MAIIINFIGRSQLRMVSLHQGHAITVFKVTDLVSPLIDDRHVDVVHKNGQFLSSWRPVRGSHTLVHIALYGPLATQRG